MRVLFLILARGGSKGIPRKNLTTIRGLSLVGYKAISALQSKYCSELMISTDDPEIRDEATKFGVACPFLRPAALSTDSAQADDAILHAMEFVKTQGKSFDSVMMLQPTSPFTLPQHYNDAVEAKLRNNATLVTGVGRSPFSSIISGRIEADGSIRTIVEKLASVSNINRQNHAQEVVLNGAFFLMDWNVFYQNKRRYTQPNSSFAILMDEIHSIDIDSELDLDFARFLAEQDKINLSTWKKFLS
jgi:CMP-N,N'-diacetyllegionaminic acid synthase